MKLIELIGENQTKLLLKEYAGPFELDEYGAWVNADTKEVVTVTDDDDAGDPAGWGGHGPAMCRIMKNLGIKDIDGESIDEVLDSDDGWIKFHEYAYANNWVRIIFSEQGRGVNGRGIGICGEPNNIKKIFSVVAPVFREFDAVFIDIQGSQTEYQFAIPTDLPKLRQWFGR